MLLSKSYESVYHAKDAQKVSKLLKLWASIKSKLMRMQNSKLFATDNVDPSFWSVALKDCTITSRLQNSSVESPILV